MRELPPHLRRAVGRFHAENDLWRNVRRLELFGVQVVVRRLQLGNPNADGFGQMTTIYKSPRKEKSHDEAGE